MRIKRIKVSSDIIQDAKNIFDGVYAPLTGFLRSKDLQSVLGNMRLSNGEIWSIPIVLDISKEDCLDLQNESEVIIESEDGSWARLNNIEIYSFDKNELAQKTYGTLDNTHPGVASIEKMQEYLIGGDVVEISLSNKIFEKYNLTPQETRDIFRNKNWKTIVAFQTRNVPHCGHEFLQKEALKLVDGLFVQPVVGEKKVKDFKDEYILSAYEILIDKHYPQEKVVLGILPIKMRYAGPREALMHALIRKNYGCTHFIVGRDHAGVGDFYHPTAAQKIFDNFSQEELGIEIIKFEEVVYDKKNDKHCFVTDCEPADALNFSGTKLREFIKTRECPPEYLIRPEIYELLLRSQSALVENMDKNKNKTGLVLWFTGLSAAGKSTIADFLFDKLKEDNYKVERLDGDIVRKDLTKDLGFSRKDREENIRRVGNLTADLVKNGNIVIASFISPYRKQRTELRDKIDNFIEVFVDTPLEVCESRDPKGLYKKARAGEIKEFTGLDDPYEIPEEPEIHLLSGKIGVQECSNKVLEFLRNKEYI